MSALNPTIFVTGANGKLGREAIAELLKTISPDRIIAGVRNLAAAGELRALGVTVREADYERPATLDAAFAGADRLLFISSSENGKRVPQHQNVIDAAVRAHVGFIAYTSILHADTTPIDLAVEHCATEAGLAQSGVPFALLRNGWYFENYLAAAPSAIEHGAVVGSSGDGMISAAPRADYAAAAAAVMASTDDQAGRVYELAGDGAFTKAQLAAELASQSGKPVVYKNIPEAEYAKMLEGFGLPAALAALLAQSDAATADGALFDDSRTMSRLIGRPTGSLHDAVANALQAQHA